MSRYFSYPPYVPVAERRRKAEAAAKKLAKKSGRALAPVSLASKKIATTFWGRSWCDNLEAYSDYANRLPRGRSYVRNGSVIDLQITRGQVEALPRSGARWAGSYESAATVATCFAPSNKSGKSRSGRSPGHRCADPGEHAVGDELPVRFEHHVVGGGHDLDRRAVGLCRRRFLSDGEHLVLLAGDDEHRRADLLRARALGQEHLDLHPENVLLAASGSQVIDWAGARAGHWADDVAQTS